MHISSSPTFIILKSMYHSVLFSKFEVIQTMVLKPKLQQTTANFCPTFISHIFYFQIINEFLNSQAST